MMDESLSLMQRALGLLNSVAIDPALLESEKAPAKASSGGGMFAKKKKTEEPTIDNVDNSEERAPIASIKPQA